jgi:uncharacterized protein
VETYNRDILRHVALGEFALHHCLAGASIHGLSHWNRVNNYGMALAKLTEGVDIEVVQAFALVHDCCRHNDGSDYDHGVRAASWMDVHRNDALAFLTDEQYNKLRLAVGGHVDGRVTDDPTIGVCWDADRLDIGRVGSPVNPNLLSTQAAKDWVAGWERFSRMAEKLHEMEKNG